MYIKYFIAKESIAYIEDKSQNKSSHLIWLPTQRHYKADGIWFN